MSDELLLIDGTHADLEVVEDVVEVIEVAEQGPPGPPGPAGEGLDPDQQAALDGANAPSAGNPFATMADLTTGSTTLYAPAAVAAITGSIVSGNVAAIASANDGSVLTVQEDVAGMTVDITFTGVDEFNNISAHIRYAGGAQHVWEWQLYNWLTAQWDVLGSTLGAQAYLTWLNLPTPVADAYIGPGGQVDLRWKHISAGNASHQLIIDYVGLVATLSGSGLPPEVTQVEAEAGTDVGIRSWSVLRVWQAIAAKLGSILTTRGDILYRGAAGLARLPKGASGQVLTMGADDPAWAEVAAGGGSTLLTTVSLAGLGTVSIDLTPYPLGVGEEYVIEGSVTCSGGLWLRMNGVTTGTLGRTVSDFGAATLAGVDLILINTANYSDRGARFVGYAAPLLGGHSILRAIGGGFGSSGSWHRGGALTLWNQPTVTSLQVISASGTFGTGSSATVFKRKVTG